MTDSSARTPDEPAEGAPPTAAELLRAALVNDDDPRFPWWLPLPGLTLALVWAAYRGAFAAAAGEPSLAELLRTLVWPGTAIFALASAATWFGWQLEID